MVTPHLHRAIYSRRFRAARSDLLSAGVATDCANTRSRRPLRRRDPRRRRDRRRPNRETLALPAPPGSPANPPCCAQRHFEALDAGQIADGVAGPQLGHVRPPAPDRLGRGETADHQSRPDRNRSPCLRRQRGQQPSQIRPPSLPVWAASPRRPLPEIGQIGRAPDKRTARPGRSIRRHLSHAIDHEGARNREANLIASSVAAIRRSSRSSVSYPRWVGNVTAATRKFDSFRMTCNSRKAVADSSAGRNSPAGVDIHRWAPGPGGQDACAKASETGQFHGDVQVRHSTVHPGWQPSEAVERFETARGRRGRSSDSQCDDESWRFVWPAARASGL